MRIESVTTAEELAGLAPAWDPLLARSGTNSIFLSHAWVTTWWGVYGADFKLRVLVARGEDDAVLGIAPFVIGRGPGRLMGRLPHLQFLGQPTGPLAEHLDVIVPADASPAIVRDLIAAAMDLETRWDVLLLARVPETSVALGHARDALRLRGLESECVRTWTSPYVELPASFDDLLASRSRNFRRQYRNSRNRLAREGEVRLLVGGRDLPVDAALDEVIRLHGVRWGGGGNFASTHYLEFHRRLCRVLGEQGALFLGLLDVGGRRVAARYDFVHGGKVWCFQGGREEGLERMRPGTVLTGLALEWAIGRGLGEYDFLSGDESYKERWATGERRLVDVRAFRDRPRVRWTRRLQGLKNALRRHAHAADGSE